MRMQPNELRQVAKYLRYLGSDLDHIHWCIRTSWGRLDSGWENFADGIIQVVYDGVGGLLAAVIESLYQSAWMLEATVSWVDEADRQTATEFMVIEATWGMESAEIRLVETTCPNKADYA